MTASASPITRRELTPEEAVQVHEGLCRLRQIAEELAAKERLYEERLDIYRRLLGLSVYQRVIGDAAKVSDIAVAQAVRKAAAEARRSTP